ncbi:MAG: Fic family protein [Alphaproteobacteria bacterium]|nr:Fic family protein [Alphaproteobacteria bacterium]
MTIPYALPEQWLRYDAAALVAELAEGKGAVLALAAIPFQRAWADAMQAIELKREIAGTSRIEGAEFTERELDEALAGRTPQDQLTRSQRQARSASEAYRWIAQVPPGRPVDAALIREVHRRIVTGCDDDLCPPGELRGQDQNVVFGRPRHRGVDGGARCVQAFDRLCAALGNEFRAHDPLIQALALHYHLGAMHPFLDGNGRTARALKALLLRRAQLKDTLFIAMSNYYYDEKDRYLAALSDARDRGHDLTPFLKFGLAGIAFQCKRLLREVGTHVAKSLFRDVMARMYARLKSTRKRALAKRQVAILSHLLDATGPIELEVLYASMRQEYESLKAPESAFAYDLGFLDGFTAISTERVGTARMISVRLEWATEITETSFYERLSSLPEAKTKQLFYPRR